METLASDAIVTAKVEGYATSVPMRARGLEAQMTAWCAAQQDFVVYYDDRQIATSFRKANGKLSWELWAHITAEVLMDDADDLDDVDEYCPHCGR